MAFCAWLSERLGYAIQLPTEWQWQQAACSGQSGFNYPWGPDYQTGYANINETKRRGIGPHNLQRTTAVGIYPQGNSLQGVSDLCGNVWEWCLNTYDEPANSQLAMSLQRWRSLPCDFSWLSSQDFPRVVRGSWYENEAYSQELYTSSRNHVNPRLPLPFLPRFSCVLFVSNLNSSCRTVERNSDFIAYCAV